MSTESYVGQSWGPHHSGSGNQYIHIGDAARGERADRDPRRAAKDAATWLKQRFVYPEGFDRARNKLESSNVVLLTSEPGNGARSAAKILLWELPHGQEQYRELLDQAEEEGKGSGARALDPGQVENEAALLLDLTDVEENRYQAFMWELPSFRVTVREKRAHLTVVLAPARKRLLNQELADVVVPLGRPTDVHVLRRHLLTAGVRPAQHELPTPELAAELARGSMSDIAGLAEEIVRARDGARGHGLFSTWLNTARSAVSPGDEDALKLLTQQTTAPARALLVSTAFLQDAPPETVYGATGRLLDITGTSAGHVPLLQHPPFNERLKDFGASTEKEGRRVRFEKPKLADAVRTFVWDNFPQWRSHLHDWIGRAAELPAADSEILLQLVTRYTDQRLRTGPPGHLTDLAAGWTGKSATSLHQLLAARILGTGSSHPRYGSHVRRWIYRCARDTDDLPNALAHVLVGVCSEALAVYFPEQALVRLRHLSHQRDRDVRRSAREALRRITASDDHLYRHLLKRLSTENERTVRSDTTTFLELAAPVRLIEDAATRTRLTELWTAVLLWQAPTAWAPVFEDWLNSAMENGRSGSRVLDVLAGTCLANSRNLSPVYAAACRWAGGDVTRRAVADALWDRAKAALAPHPTTASL